MLVWDLRSSNLTSFGFLSSFGNAAMLTFYLLLSLFTNKWFTLKSLENHWVTSWECLLWKKCISDRNGVLQQWCGFVYEH